MRSLGSWPGLSRCRCLHFLRLSWPLSFDRNIMTIESKLPSCETSGHAHKKIVLLALSQTWWSTRATDHALLAVCDTGHRVHARMFVRRIPLCSVLVCLSRPCRVPPLGVVLSRADVAVVYGQTAMRHAHACPTDSSSERSCVSPKNLRCATPRPDVAVVYGQTVMYICLSGFGTNSKDVSKTRSVSEVAAGHTRRARTPHCTVA